MKGRCERCGMTGHTVEQCTPPPCTECGGVEAHVSDACSKQRALARVPSPLGAADSARWCATCKACGDHPTDRHSTPRSSPVTVEIPEAFAAALVQRCANDALYCELVPAKGDQPRWNGGCPHATTAVKWEDGFLDNVCDWHADEAEKRPGVTLLRRGAQ